MASLPGSRRPALDRPQDDFSGSMSRSALLSDRLRETRATSKKARRRTDFGPSSTALIDEDVFLAEAATSDHGHSTRSLAEPSITSSDRPSRGHTQQPNAQDLAIRELPGLREMDEKLQKLEKLNFDLKMEVHHRRQKEQKLHKQLVASAAQIVKAERLQKEHTELMHINESLVKELQKRDDAVKEAVDIIVDLESKMEELQDHLSYQRPTTKSDSGYGGLETPSIIPPSSPPLQLQTPQTPSNGRLSASVATKREWKPRDRVPSFVSDGKASTQALRDAYMDTTTDLRPVQSFMSILSERDSNQGETLRDMGSPRLSVLSKSSFPSIYCGRPSAGQSQAIEESRFPGLSSENNAHTRVGDDDLPEDGHDCYRQELEHRQSSIKRVSQWIDDRDVESTYNRSHTSPSDLSLSIYGDLQVKKKTITGGNSDTAQQIMQDLESDYAHYPNGGSIVTGTPSRFQSRHATPPVTNLMFDGDGIDEVVLPPPIRRRMSSAEVHFSHVKTDRPVYCRAETSPVGASPHTARSSHSPDTPGSREIGMSRLPLGHEAETAQSPAVQTHTANIPARSPSIRKSIRSSFARKTQKMLRRMSTGPNEPSPQPQRINERPITQARQLANNEARIELKRSDSHHEKTIASIGMHYASQTEAARRRSIDPDTLIRRKDTEDRLRVSQGPLERTNSLRDRRGTEMSKNGAQAAWEVSSAGGGRGTNLNERDMNRDVGRKPDRRGWKA